MNNQLANSYVTPTRNTTYRHFKFCVSNKFRWLLTCSIPRWGSYRKRSILNGAAAADVVDDNDDASIGNATTRRQYYADRRRPTVQSASHDCSQQHFYSPPPTYHSRFPSQQRGWSAISISTSVHICRLQSSAWLSNFLPTALSLNELLFEFQRGR